MILQKPFKDAQPFSTYYPVLADAHCGSGFFINQHPPEFTGAFYLVCKVWNKQHPLVFLRISQAQFVSFGSPTPPLLKSQRTPHR